jgi:hypothetical protein
MATYSATGFSADKPLYLPKAGEVAVATATVEITAAALLADTLRFFYLPANCKVVGGRLHGDDIDSGTGVFELDIGVAGNTDQFLDSGALSGAAIAGVKAAGLSIALDGELVDGPVTLSAKTLVIGTVAVAPNAGGTGTVSLVVFYTGV